MYVIVLPLSSFLRIGSEKVIYFYVFFPKHSSWPFASLLIMKWLSYVEPLWNTIRISFGALYFKLQILF